MSEDWRKISSVEEWLNTPWPSERPKPKPPAPKAAEVTPLWPWRRRRWTAEPVAATSYVAVEPTTADFLEEARRANARAARDARRRADPLGCGIWVQDETMDEIVRRQNGDD
jgi:hypothetical protein